jgi:hypothetical protein
MPARNNNDEECPPGRKPPYYTALQADTNRRLDTLERRGDRFATDLSRARETPWAILIGGISVLLIILGMLSGIYLQWINSAVKPLDEFTKYNFGQIEKAFDQTRQDRQEIKERVDKDIDLVRTEINQLRTTVFPLEVHRQRWELYDTEIKALQDRDRETNQNIAALYSPADKFKELQEQLDQLRELIDRKLMNGFAYPVQPAPQALPPTQ